ncbi:MAG: hypothetical protein QGG09_10770 [Pirellulaceae bacterium]|nr:hypothetical protein [Pirellulaceae bacterium]
MAIRLFPRKIMLAAMAAMTLFALNLTASTIVADEVIPTQPPLRWWKGNIHTHTFWSDGTDFPEMISEWYRTRDYNFLALSDHNVLSEGERWMPYSQIQKRGGDQVLEKYLKRFGSHWVETRGHAETPTYAVRLKPLNEFRALMEQRGQFIMIQGEEITDRALGKPVHMNATNIKTLIAPLGGQTIQETVNNNLRAVQQQAERTGRPILLHINHPNFGFAMTAEDLAAVVEERFFEVYNGHPGVEHLGNAVRPGVERLWDIANTLRVAELEAPPLYGVGTDDSHEYHGRPGSRPGRGWIMVRSRHLTPEYLLRAINAGDFYASSGVTLRDVRFSETDQTLTVEIDAEPDVEYRTDFIGTLIDYDRSSKERVGDDGKAIVATRKYSADVGRTLKTVKGAMAQYKLTGRELYVRAVVTSSRPATDPSFKDQRQQAWSQPVGWSKHLSK